MSGIDTSPRDVKALVARYRAIGLGGGLFLGGMAGLVVAGPYFHEWSGSRSLLVTLGSAGVGALIGWIAAEIAAASLASGPGAAMGGDTSGFGGSGGGYGDGGDAGGGGDS